LRGHFWLFGTVTVTVCVPVEVLPWPSLAE
jgi:hypothetical protein